jgi:hypothetical protein
MLGRRGCRLLAGVTPHNRSFKRAYGKPGRLETTDFSISIDEANEAQHVREERLST